MVRYFYGQKNEDGFLSNFYCTKFKVSANIIGLSNELEVNTAEKAIMWLKALLMDDSYSAYYISINNNPATCKALGRQIKPFDEKKWLEWRDKIALEVLTRKFENPHLKQMLKRS